MQQIVYDIIERSIQNEHNNISENNSVHSDYTLTPPLSTKNGSNNSNKDSQKDIIPIKKKIFFIDYNYKNINLNNNQKKEKKFLEKKRKRFFLIKKIQKNKNETTLYKIPKIDKIIFNDFKINKIEENKVVENNTNNHRNKNKFFFNIFVNKDKKVLKNNLNIKQDENINNNIIILKNDNLKNNNKNNNNNQNIKDKNIENKNIIKKEENQENKEKEVNNKGTEIKKKKKSRYTTEKELQIAYEKKFLENINKKYSDKEYEEDMKQCLKDKKMKFMKDNFPIMFQKDKFYLYSILPKKRLSSKEYYIKPEFFDENKFKANYETYYNSCEIIANNEIKDVKYSNNKIFKITKTKKLNKNNNLINDKNINNQINDNIINDENNLIKKETSFSEPRKVWSKKNGKEINIDNFFDDCIQIWPFDECCFVKEIALEFLMQKNYSIRDCLDDIKEFIIFMKQRAKELDFPIISESVKTIKKYHLRKTNFN